jgi:hypothetical protein
MMSTDVSDSSILIVDVSFSENSSFEKKSKAALVFLTVLTLLI